MEKVTQYELHLNYPFNIKNTLVKVEMIVLQQIKEFNNPKDNIKTKLNLFIINSLKLQNETSKHIFNKGNKSLRTCLIPLVFTHS